MYDSVFRRTTLAAGMTLAVLLAGCASTKAPAPKKNASAGQCQAGQAGDTLIGSWLSSYKQKGVVGQLHVLFQLKPDGTMAYTEQLKRPNKPPQGLDETGCWRHEGQSLVLQTTKSNGAPVEANDPIYTNRYSIVSHSGKTLSLSGPNGAMKARRMPPGYRLPY